MRLGGLTVVFFLALSLTVQPGARPASTVSGEEARGTSLDSPVPFGQWATLPPDNISLRIVSVEFGANPNIVVNQSDNDNVLAQPGYTAVRIVADFRTNEESRRPQNASDDVHWDLVGQSKLGYEATHDYSCGNEAVSWGEQQDVYAGGTVRIAVCWVVPLEVTEDPVLVASHKSMAGGLPVYFALEDLQAGTPAPASPAASPTD